MSYTARPRITRPIAAIQAPYARWGRMASTFVMASSIIRAANASQPSTARITKISGRSIATGTSPAAYGRVSSAMTARAAKKTRIPLPSNALPLSAGSPSPPPTPHHGRRHATTITMAARAASWRPRPSGRRCISVASVADRVDLGAEHAHEAEVAVVLGVVEAVADDELVGDREPDVVDRDVDEAPGGLVEQGADPERLRVLAAQVADQVIERQAGIDDVFHDQDVLAFDRRGEVLQDPDQARGLRGAPTVRAHLHEVDPDGHRDGPHEIGHERQRALEDGHERQPPVAVVRAD